MKGVIINNKWEEKNSGKFKYNHSTGIYEHKKNGTTYKKKNSWKHDFL